MKDVQGSLDKRGIAIDSVGITGVKYPITLLDRANKSQRTIADVTLSANLPHFSRGTHMSRLMEVLNQHHDRIRLETLPLMLQDVANRLNAEAVQVVLGFPYFMEKTAPVSKAKSLMSYECTFSATANGSVRDFVLGVRVPISTLCPCSKTISDYGAHNQRGIADIQVRTVVRSNGEPAFIWIEELIEIAEQCCSAPVYSLLKRPDERWVTMAAYDKPMFVEDVIREITAKLKHDRRVAWLRAHVESEESIHNHSAFATLEWRRKTPGNAGATQSRVTMVASELEKYTEQLARTR
jgi:GTP cyclohydrolase I